MTDEVFTFHNLGIAPALLAVLDRLKFTIPTPIQHATIPVGVQGSDVIGIAQTGTGKTLAFGIPMVQRLAAEGGRGLIILPTRELALQVDEALQQIGRPLKLRTVVLIGGAPMGRQKSELKGDPQIIVATPGRLIDHLQTGTVELGRVKILVLDEADRMLDMGFAPQIEQILRAVPRERQTMLYSATMPPEIVGIAKGHMKLPLHVEVAPSGTTVEEISHELYVVKKEDKLALLDRVLGDYRGPVLVFSRTKHGARKILRDVLAAGHSGAELHSNRSLNQRREALDGFKSGKYRVLIATDIAARGIDVTGIELVVNYDLPGQAEDYVHRVGRTGRAGRSGHAISFATPDQASEVRGIERLIRSELPLSEESEHVLEAPAPRSRPAAGPRPTGSRTDSRAGSRTDSRRGRPPARPARESMGDARGPASDMRGRGRSAPGSFSQPTPGGRPTSGGLRPSRRPGSQTRRGA